MVKIKWTEKASGDLEAIYKYIDGIIEPGSNIEILAVTHGAREIKKVLSGIGGL